MFGIKSSHSHSVFISNLCSFSFFLPPSITQHWRVEVGTGQDCIRCVSGWDPDPHGHCPLPHLFVFFFHQLSPPILPLMFSDTITSSSPSTPSHLPHCLVVIAPHLCCVNTQWTVECWITEIPTCPRYRFVFQWALHSPEHLFFPVYMNDWSLFHFFFSIPNPIHHLSWLTAAICNLEPNSGLAAHGYAFLTWVGLCRFQKMLCKKKTYETLFVITIFSSRFYWI